MPKIVLDNELCEALEKYGEESANVYWNGQLLTMDGLFNDETSDYCFEARNERKYLKFHNNLRHGAVVNIEFPFCGLKFVAVCEYRTKRVSGPFL